MKKKGSKCLVVDASVLLAAGGEGATNPTSARCRDFLNSVYEICHTIAATPALRAEWKREPTRKRKGRRLFSATLTWLRHMNGKGKIIYLEDVSPDEKLRLKVSKAEAREKDKQAMLEDIHLVETALRANKIIVSCDEECRRLFAAASVGIGQLREIMWVNPDKEYDSLVSWLNTGAPKEKKRTLGSNAP